MSHLYRCLVFLFAIAGQSSAQAPAPRAIPDEPSCPRCTVTTRTLATLGTDDGPGSLIGKPMSVNVDARGRYWVFQELEPPSLFAASGMFLQVVGRKGSGPGEFRSANHGIVVGDSMLVFDWLVSRAAMLGPDLKATRTILIQNGLGDLVAVDWPGMLVTQGYFPNAKPPNSTMHRVSLAESEIRVLGSFGPRGTGGPMGNVEVSQIIGSARDGIWSTYWNKPHFTKWDRNGVMKVAFSRRYDWYTGEGPSSIGTRDTPPKPRTALIAEDAGGLVWYFIHRPAPTWREGWEGVKPFNEGREVRTKDMVYDKMFTTYLEVIDPAQGRVVASLSIDGYVFETLPGGRVALYGADINGIPRVRIAQLSLSGR